jgi:hypothetical protein
MFVNIQTNADWIEAQVTTNKENRKMNKSNKKWILITSVRIQTEEFEIWNEITFNHLVEIKKRTINENTGEDETFNVEEISLRMLFPLLNQKCSIFSLLLLRNTVHCNKKRSHPRIKNVTFPSIQT